MSRELIGVLRNGWIRNSTDHRAIEKPPLRLRQSIPFPVTRIEGKKILSSYRDMLLVPREARHPVRVPRLKVRLGSPTARFPRGMPKRNIAYPQTILAFTPTVRGSFKLDSRYTCPSIGSHPFPQRRARGLGRAERIRSRLDLLPDDPKACPPHPANIRFE